MQAVEDSLVLGGIVGRFIMIVLATGMVDALTMLHDCNLISQARP